ncbi:MAG: PSD1 and planctomycete cytochrome C domain-containing protein [Chthoniobacter sp.]|uniref:PSD1 and planctomycete cytochrome C domain-containing protein n=1 Tax=Chthoniobacter sp. TaxID=2510640 RepID=UPI0032ABC155
MNFRLTLLATTVLSASAWAAQDAATANHAADMEKGTALFNSDVAALLNEHCVKCHGGEKGSKGALDLTTRELALKGGDTGPAFVPGKSADSLLVQSIRHEDRDLQMPKKADKLPDEVIAKIVQWVDLGAPYAKPLIAGKSTRDRSKVTDDDRKFWSFQPLAKPEPPVVKNEAWCRTPIDRFILAKCEEKGIWPSPPADKVVLIRRAYFDLIGLPPTPEQVARFESDTEPNAFEKVVDELLASPHYGERWGRHWLDLARYAESHGYEQDYDRPNAYQYRDYVIRALNADQPYDEFVRWQLAGDELAPENPEAWKATGFLAAGTHATQITLNQAEKERYDELDDMAATTGNAFLGLSVGCARCHDHKFDPIPTADYYRLISTFTTTVRSDYDIEVNATESRARHAAWEKDHAPLTAALAQWEKDKAPARFDAWRAGTSTLPQPAWLTLAADKLGITGTYYVLSAQKTLPDGSYLIGVTAGTPDTYAFTTKISGTKLSALRLEALLDKSLPGYGPGWSENGGFGLSDLTATAKLADGRTKTLKFAGDKPAWKLAKGNGEARKVFALAEPLETEGGVELTVSMKFVTGKGRENLGRFRLSFSSQADAPAEEAPFPFKSYALAREVPLRSPSGDTYPTPPAPKPEQVAALKRLYYTTDPEWQKLAEAVRADERAQPRAQYTKALVCSEGLPAVRLHTQGPDFYEKTYLLKRGDLNQKQDEAVPGFLQVVTRADESRWVTPPAADARTPMKRAALARWITDTDGGAGQLAARVMANRVWQHHFGRGIVSTPSDFGAQGDKPTHPELLDYLAGELIRGGWRLKSLHKAIMLSKVYQESAHASAEQIAADPNNTLFAHRARQRLEGEVIRDAILAVSGLIDPTMFGPGTLDPAMKRRAIYFQIKRSQLPPMMIAFDGPDTLQSMGQRSSTTVAPQSLLLMNNTLVREAAKAWVKKLDPKLQLAAVNQAYEQALGRNPTAAEIQIAYAFLKMQGDTYGDDNGSGSQKAFADFCQTLFGLNEFLYVN